MTILQKTSAVLVAAVFCFLFMDSVKAEDLYCNCDYEITISGCRGQRQGTSMPVETGGTYFVRFPFELDGSKTLEGIESAMNGFIVASCAGKVVAAVDAANSRAIHTTWHGVTTPITSSTCAGRFNAGPPVSLDGGVDIPGSLISISCSVGALGVSAPAPSLAAAVPAYEPIAWSFPTDKINALNKVGISGTGTTQVQLLIGRLIKYVVGFLGALALCLVIYSGLRFMLSEGDEGKQEESLKMMLWAGVGIVALLGSYSMVTFVLGVLRI